MRDGLNEIKFWNITAQEVALILETDTENGLSREEAARRLKIFGRNTLKQNRRTDKLRILLRQLRSPLILVLIAAGVVTLLVSHFRDATFIFITVLANSLLGFWQENKAENALAELKTYLRQRTRVMRDGKEREIDAEETVLGDIIRLSQGDRVSADASIIFVNDFR